MQFEISTLVLAAGILGLGYVALEPNNGGPMVTQTQPGGFVVSNDRYRFEYWLDREETTTSGVLTMTGAQAGVSEGGAAMTLHYLSEDSLADFRATQKGGTCYAPFFNQHAQHKILIPANPEIENKLRAVEFDDYSKVSMWRRFSVRGYCIQGAKAILLDGKPGQMATNMFDNCLTMVATGLDVGDAPVVKAEAPR